ncbi:MAG: PAS domain S-box protein [Myxococcales bacterium]|nr:PAS domain S-box protein [Myxococcales bacterium]
MKRKNWLSFAVTAMLIIGIFFIWWTARIADRRQRDVLLDQGRLVAQTIDFAQLQTITGTEADLNSSTYLHLKERLTLIRSIDTKCRFIYLTGRRIDGAVFFLVDSEPPDSKDYSPPGQTYTEASADFRRLFDTGQSAVQGPYTDRWGTWVSALVPILDPHGGAVVAVLGMDIDASTWKREIISQIALPIALMTLVLVFGLFLIIQRRAHREIQQRERELRESEDRYSNFIANAGEGIFRIDLNPPVAIDQPREILETQIAERAVIGEVNVALSAMYGLPPDKMVGHLVTEFAPNCGAQMADLAGSSDFKIAEREEQEVAADGRPVYIVESYRGIVENGLLKRVWGVQRNITARKLAEEARRGSEVFLNRIFEDSPFPMWISDAQGSLIRINKACCKLLNITADEVLGQYNIFQDNIVEEQGFMPLIRRVYEKGEVVRFPLVWNSGTLRSLQFQKTVDIIIEVNVTPVLDASGRVKHAIFQHEDITARKKAEAALRRSEEDYRTLFQFMEQGIVFQDAEGRITNANPAAEKILGLSLEQLQGRKSIDPAWRSIHEDGMPIPGEEHPSMVALRTGKPLLGKTMAVFQPQFNEMRWILIDAMPEFLPGESTPYRVFTIFSDITERRKAEQELRESENKYRELTERINDIVWSLDTESMRFLYVSPSIKKLLGYTPEEIIAQPLEFSFQPEEREKWTAVLRQRVSDYLSGKVPPDHTYRDEIEQPHKDGTAIWTEIATTFYQNPHTGKVEVHGLSRDISERKRAAQALKESEEWYRALVEASPDPILVYDLQGNILSASRQAPLLYGVETVEELLADMKNIMDLLDEEDRRKVAANIARSLNSGHSETMEYRIRLKNGGRALVEAHSSTLRDADGNPRYFISLIRDITERKQVETALRESREQLQSIFRVAPTGIGLVRNRINFEVNQRLCEMTGYTPEELLGQSARLLYPTQEEFEYVGTEKYRQIAAQGTGAVETRWRRKDGSIMDIWLVSTPMDPRDLAKGVIFTALDITDRKRAENALRESEERFRSIVEASPMGMHMYRLEADGRLIFTGANPAANRILGLDHQPFIGKTIEEAFPPLIETEIPTRYREIAKNGGLWQTSSVTYRDNQIHGAYEVYAFHSGADTMTALFLDITERLIAEERIRQSEQKFRDMAEQLEDVLYTTDDEGKVTYITPSATNIFGWRPEEMIGRVFPEFLPADQIPIAMEKFREAMATGKRTTRLELLIKRKDGGTFNGEVSGSLAQAGEQSVGTLGLIRDITERKRAETALRESQERLQSIFRVAPTGIGVTRNQIFQEVNQRLCEITGYSQEELIGQNVQMLYPTIEEAQLTGEVLFRQIAQKGTGTQEIRCRRKDGSIIDILLSLTPMSPGDPSVSITFTALDITERKRAEIALRESEERWQYALEGAGDGVWDWNAQTNQVLFSSQLKRMLGYEDDEFGEDFSAWDRLVHPMDREHVYRDLDQHLAGQSLTYVSEYRMRCKDGTYKWILDRGKVISWTPDGKPLRVIGTHSDISQRKQAEEEKARLTAILESTTDLVAMATPDSQLTYLNPAGKQMLGWAADERVAEHQVADVHPAWATKMITTEAFPTAARDGVWKSESAIQHHDGREIPVSQVILSHPAFDGSIEFFSAIMRDITEEKRAAAEMVRREQMLLRQTTLVLSLMQEGSLFQGNLDKSLQELTEACAEIMATERVSVWLYSEDYQRLECVDLFERSPRRHSQGQAYDCRDFPSYTQAHQLGQVIAATDVYTDPRTREVPESYHRDNRICSLLDAPIWLQGRMGGLLSFEAVDQPRQWAQDEEQFAINMASLVSLAFAVRDRRQAEQEKDKLENQLRQAMKMEAVGRLAGGVAHDFNNLLTSISGYTEILMGDLRQGDPMHADLSEIQKAAQRAASLTAQLLAFSRKQVIDPRVIDLNELLAGATKMLKRLIGEDIELVFRPAKDLGSVKVDPHQIEQVIINLAVNARDAMPDGGKLTIETANAEIDEEYARGHLDVKPGAYIQLAVSDDGCGMSPEIQAHLFEPFFTTKEKGKGTGLGLSMIYGIVRQNSGFINVYSEIGVGTVFKIYLPRVTGKVESVAKGIQAALPTGTETILLVEDEDMVRNLAQKVLERQGYKVIAVDHGGRAYLLAEDPAVRFDLLLTDVVMPNMNGRQLYEKILSLRPGLRVLYMSGYTENAIAHHGVLDEGTNFLQKPFAIDSLVRKVREVLDGK